MLRRILILTSVVLAGLVQARTASAHENSLCRENWPSFAARFVQSDGRVIDPANAGITHTEGLGVAMLAAQRCDDRVRFDQIWHFARLLKRRDGLYSWKYIEGQGIADRNDATDGDIYIAWALLRASRQWHEPDFEREALLTIQAIRNLTVVTTGHGQFILPGVDGFARAGTKGVPVVNPSYWIWPAFTEFASIDKDPIWNKLTESGLRLLSYARFGHYGLPSDWLELKDPVSIWAERPARFGYEAIRVPLFLAWAKKTDHVALRAAETYMHKPGFPAWVALTTSNKAEYKAPLGFEAVARLVRHSVDPKQVFVLPAGDTDYFSSSLMLLAGIAAKDLGVN